MEASNIRVDATLLQENQNNLVRIMGSCESVDKNTNCATIISNGPITLDLNHTQLDKQLIPGKNYEIIGKVSNSSLKVHVYSVIQLSDNLNLDFATKFVQYSQKVPDIYIASHD
ncbi:unnamed protein product [Candida verbasci]|uniref:Replication factor A protein 3 n=1 Tax=Candida verbasci TaxID=1227364 RepID=A0A9W4TTW5_9ASCO|nr:unnamed protein product [Candida verbasci]